MAGDDGWMVDFVKDVLSWLVHEVPPADVPHSVHEVEVSMSADELKLLMLAAVSMVWT